MIIIIIVIKITTKTLFQLSKQLVNIYKFKLYIEIIYKY